jgi:GAF domain-containing protein/HAMP domain-containing protein
VFTAAFLSMALLYAYLSSQSPTWQLFVVTGLMAATALASGYSMIITRNHQVDRGIGVTIITILVVLPLTSIFIHGLGLMLGLAQLAGISIVLVTVVSRRYAVGLGVLNIVSAILTIVLDVFGSVNRFTLPLVQTLLPMIVGLGLLVLALIMARDFRNYSLRIKIIIGILATSGVALGMLSYMALTRSGQIISTVSSSLEKNVSDLAEAQLVNTVQSEATRANQFFVEVEETVEGLTANMISLHEQKDVLGEGTYWNAADRLLTLGSGQHGNSSREKSSVFVPAGVRLSDTIIADLNTTAYMDFSTPQLLEANSTLLAVYYIDTRGIVRYYPNINLASLLPADFDATTRPYYEITSPEFNPNRETRWTIPYVDAAVGGLVVTVATPVYVDETFKGVIAADIQLTNITGEISKIQIGQTGYAFILDDAGRVISMPERGYDMFGIDPASLSEEEFFKQTVVGKGPDELQFIIRRMVGGGNGINTVNIDGVTTYISFAPIRSNGYSIALVVPVDEMQSALIASRAQVQQQIQSAIRTTLITLTILFASAVMVSLGLGQLIAAPVTRLTEVASLIAAGDLAAQATASTRDEIGTLATAFNTMTSRLRETLEGLEKTVSERTSELVAANERNQRRARQFEAIAEVAGAISSTNDLNSLLAQIPEVINREFGFYHIGIFLLDTAREYAVLSAANSAGGRHMLDRGHRLKVGETGIVGFVTGTGKPRVALDTGADAVFFNNPDLPETRSEIALPLHTAGEVIGALDVQSTESNAFDHEDIRVLGTLADQVSIAIQNARQYEETRRALAESDSLSRQFVQRGWSRFTRTRKLEGIRHTGARMTLLYRHAGKGDGKGKSEQEQLRPRGRGAVLSLPVKLRGEVIGTVDIRSPENRKFDQDELDVVTAIIERSAIAMENARLLAESQQLAAKERTIGEIAAKISAQSDVDALLKTAAQELGRSLPGMQIAIQLKKDETE